MTFSSGWKGVLHLLQMKQLHLRNSNSDDNDNLDNKINFSKENKVTPLLPFHDFDSNNTSPVKVSGKVFSDFLFHSHLIATLELPKKYLQIDNIQKRDYRTFSIESFRREFEIPNIPVVFTNYNMTKEGSNCKGQIEEEEISLSALHRRFPEAKVHASGYSLSLKEFMAYW